MESWQLRELATKVCEKRDHAQNEYMSCARRCPISNTDVRESQPASDGILRAPKMKMPTSSLETTLPSHPFHGTMETNCRLPRSRRQVSRNPFLLPSPGDTGWMNLELSRCVWSAIQLCAPAYAGVPVYAIMHPCMHFRLSA